MTSCTLSTRVRDVRNDVMYEVYAMMSCTLSTRVRGVRNDVMYTLYSCMTKCTQ